MNYIRVAQWLAYVPFDLLLSLAAFLWAPVAVAIDRVPGWMLAPDNPPEGDSGHVERWRGRSAWMQRVAWLWRNRAYNARWLFARSAGPVRLRGNKDATNKPVVVEGKCVRTTPEGYWHVYLIRRLPGGFVLRANLGWKLWDSTGALLFGQMVFYVNPFLRDEA
jgi:hypothetical protein